MNFEEQMYELNILHDNLIRTINKELEDIKKKYTDDVDFFKIKYFQSNGSSKNPLTLKSYTLPDDAMNHPDFIEITNMFCKSKEELSMRINRYCSTFPKKL